MTIAGIILLSWIALNIAWLPWWRPRAVDNTIPEAGLAESAS